MKKHYILLKTQINTGLKYLCKHVTENEKTCFTYPGSGIYWRNHLNKHGYDFATEILAECETKDECIEKGLYFSQLYDVVDSPLFANLVPEKGQGGAEVAKMRRSKSSWRGFKLVGDDNPSKRDDVRKKISDALSGRVFSDEWKKKISEACKNRPAWNKGQPNPNARKNLEKMNIQTECPHCGKIGGLGGMKRWHFENCKNLKNTG